MLDMDRRNMQPAWLNMQAWCEVCYFEATAQTDEVWGWLWVRSGPEAWQGAPSTEIPW